MGHNAPLAICPASYALMLACVATHHVHSDCHMLSKDVVGISKVFIQVMVLCLLFVWLENNRHKLICLMSLQQSPRGC